MTRRYPRTRTANRTAKPAAARHSSAAGRALRALTGHPALAELVTTLPATTLTRLYQTVGLNDAGQLMALTPPAALARALDEAVWSETDRETRFDPDVFVDWLEVWLGEGVAFTAERLLALDEDLLSLGFASVLLVADSHVSGFGHAPGDDAEVPVPDSSEDAGGPAAQIDRFLLSARQQDEWDIAIGALLALWDEAPARAVALLERLAAAHPGVDGTDTALARDAAADREARREAGGFVPASAAHAFLALAQHLEPAELLALDAYDPESARQLERLRRARRSAPPTASPTPSDVFATTPPSDAGTADPDETGSAPGPAADPAAAAELWALLTRAGVVDAPVAGLLAAPETTTLTLHRRLREVADDAEAIDASAAELAYLANVLVATVLEGEGADRARELAMAATNLGIELLEQHHDRVVPGSGAGLVRPFLVAWRTLGELPMQVVRVFEARFAELEERPPAGRAWLLGEARASLAALRSAVDAGDFDAARDALGVLSLLFDTDTCRSAAHLLDAPPAFPGLLDGADHSSRRPIRGVADLTRIAHLLDAVRAKN